MQLTFVYFQLDFVGMIPVLSLPMIIKIPVQSDYDKPGLNYGLF